MSQPDKQPNQSGYNFDPTILREYDMRGQVGKNLSEDDAFALGQAFGTYVKRHPKTEKGRRTKFCVGYDGRTTSPGLAEALIKGLISTGAKVDHIGLGPTPMLYFAVKDHMADAGVMITGSHNPPDYNGFKMTLQSGPVFGETIQELGKIAAEGDFETGDDGLVNDIDIQDTYVERLMKDFDGGRPLKIAWDNGNGAAGEILRRLTQKLPGEHILLYDDIDGQFPNHHPDPTVDENLIDLKKTVLEQNCDLGIAFDGDGDRIGVVNELGDILRCDILMTIYARDILAETPGASIIGDVKCSQVMFDEIKRLGGNAVMWKTGHSLVKAKMAELKAPLAGELSGHIFFADKYYGFDDALYCAIRLINAACEAENLSSLTKDLPVLHNTPEIRCEVEEDKKFGIVPQITERLKADKNEDISIDDIDGIRVTTQDGWWLLRPSNTQNVLVARMEASSAEGLERLKAMAGDELKKLGYNLEYPEQ
ncbi:MAG: phosphomannomutase [Micavibrio sp.]|nr:MAG: phosphomannomutase [Micavibrio sp.]